MHVWFVDAYPLRSTTTLTPLRGPAAAATRPPRRPRRKAGPITHGRGTRHGLAAVQTSRLIVLADFLHFCKLASARRMAPPEWGPLLDAAAPMLDKGFNPEKCGAEHRYGPRAAGSALRAVAHAVYTGQLGVGGGRGGRRRDDRDHSDGNRSSASDDSDDSSDGDAATQRPLARRREVDPGQPRSPHSPHSPRGDGGVAADVGASHEALAERVFAQIQHACFPHADEDATAENDAMARAAAPAGADHVYFTFDREPAVFDDVGGVELWKEFNEKLKEGRLGR